MPKPLIDRLYQLFSPEEAARVLAALRQDALVWKALAQDEFRERASDACGSQVKLWTPAGLAAVAIGNDLSVDNLALEPMSPLEPAIRQQAVRSFEEIRKRATGPMDLREAGILALALRERRRLTGVWTGLAGELLTSPGGLKTIPANIWTSAMACLAGFIPSPLELMKSLLATSFEQGGLEWVIHMLVCSLISPDDQLKLVEALLKDFPASLQLEFLSRLKTRGFDSISSKSANALLIGHPAFTNFKSKLDLDVISSEGIANRTITLQQLGEFYQIADSPAQAEACLRSAKNALNYWQVGLDLQAASLAPAEFEETDLLDLSERVQRLSPPSKKLMEELGKVFVSRTMNFDTVDQMDQVLDDPFLLLSKAKKMMAAQEPALAHELGLQAADFFVSALKSRVMLKDGEYVHSWDAASFIKGLVELSLTQEAIDCAEAMLEIRPADANLISLTAEILMNTNGLVKAKELVELAATLEPESLEKRRELARVYEEIGDWEQAYVQRKACMGNPEVDPTEDEVWFARTALQCNRPDEAVTICEGILIGNPDHGAAHGYLGKSKGMLGDYEQGILHLSRATLLIPEEADWWLALAEQHGKTGDTKGAMDTLRAAVMASPDSGDLHFALGEALLKSDQISEALPHLKRAAFLMPDNEQVSFRLCKALHSLGFLPEARRVVDNLRHRWASNPEMAYEFANIALEMGDLEAAIPALEIAVRSEKSRPEWNLVYARILLEDLSLSDKAVPGTRYQQAEQLLRKSLEMQPDNFDTRLMLAEALRKTGDYGEAFDIYGELADLPESADEDKAWKIQHGMGLAALALNNVEPGLAMLKEAAQRRPADLELHHDLAHAYMAAQLIQDAAAAAEIALGIAPDNLDNLDWFADLMVKLGKPERAVEALHCGTELAPKRPDFLVRYAQLLLQMGNLSEAKDALVMLTKNDGCPADFLRHAAYLYLRMEEPSAAQECLEKAVILTEAPSTDLLFDLAKVYDQNGRLDEAIDVIQKAAAGECLDAQICIFHADLLSRQNRLQAAQVSLEKALKILHSGPNPCQDELTAAVYQRSAKWMRQSGSVASALNQAEKSLEYAPDDVSLLLLAADLAWAMIQPDIAMKYIAQPEVSNLLAENGNTGIYLACLKAEIALEMGNPDEAAQIYAAVSQSGARDEWVATLGARVAARKGEVGEAAAAVYQLADQLVLETMKPGDNSLWLARAAIETGLWYQAFNIIDTYIQRFPNEPRGFFERGKALVLAAEAQQTCQVLGCSIHAPGVKYLSDETANQFETAFDTVGQMVRSDEISRWLVRGRLAFAPSVHSIKSFAGLAESTQEIAALINGLRSVQNVQAALQIAQKHIDDAEVMFQLALCYLDNDPDKGAELTDQLVEIAPTQPLYHAAQAMLERQAGRSGIALAAYENALKLWPEEAEWHAKSAELSIQEGDMQAGVNHWKEAIRLQPTQADYSLELGWAYLMAEDYPHAAETLERSIRLSPENPSAWFNLAQARKALGQLAEAMESALRSSELEPTGIQGLMLSGEIAQEMGELDMAREYAHMAVKRDPCNPKAIMALSKILSQQGRPDESLALIERSLSELPPSMEIDYERARLIYQLRGSQEASGLVLKLTQDYPEEPVVLTLLAQVQAEGGDIKSAERSAFKSLRLDPNQPQLALALGRLQRKAGQLDQAVHLLSQAIGLDTLNVEAYLELAQVYLDRREHAQALQTYQQATRIAPKDPRAYYQAALIMREGKDYTGAESMLENAARLAPDDLQIRRQLVGVMALNLIHKTQEANTAV